MILKKRKLRLSFFIVPITYSIMKELYFKEGLLMNENSWTETMKRYDESVKRKRRRDLLILGVGTIIATVINVVIHKHTSNINEEA